MEIRNTISSDNPESPPIFSSPSPSTARSRPSISLASISSTPELGIDERNRAYTTQSNFNVPLFSNKLPAADATDQLINEIQNEHNRHKNKFSSSFSFSTHSAADYAKRIHALLVQKQTEEHETPGSLFNFIIQNDLVGLKDVLQGLRRHSKSLGRLHHDSLDFIRVDARDVAGVF